MAGQRIQRCRASSPPLDTRYAYTLCQAKRPLPPQSISDRTSGRTLVGSHGTRGRIRPQSQDSSSSPIGSTRGRIRFERYNVGPGDIHGMVESAVWLIPQTDALQRSCPHLVQPIEEELRVRHGVRKELISLISLATSAGSVPPTFNNGIDSIEAPARPGRRRLQRSWVKGSPPRYSSNLKVCVTRLRSPPDYNRPFPGLGDQ